MTAPWFRRQPVIPLARLWLWPPNHNGAYSVGRLRPKRLTLPAKRGQIDLVDRFFAHFSSGRFFGILE